MLRSFLAKRRQKNMQKSESPWDMFYDYLDQVKNDTPEEYEGMHYELLTVSHFLISTEYADVVQQFNSHIVSYYNLSKIIDTVDCHNDTTESKTETCLHTLTYKDNTISWQNIPSVFDEEFKVFMISQLVADDIDIRLEVASTAQDDRKWFALHHDVWQKLEDDFGQEFVHSLFAPIPKQFYEPDYDFKMVSSTL